MQFRVALALRAPAVREAQHAPGVQRLADHLTVDYSKACVLCAWGMQVAARMSGAGARTLRALHDSSLGVALVMRPEAHVVRLLA